jgi:aspartate 1-decarboxylase
VQRLLLGSKIRGGKLTGTELEYEGSIAIDRDILDAADVLCGEQVHVLNVNNGERLVTYVIEAPAGSGTLMLNGPAARLAQPGDPVMVLSYVTLTDTAARTWEPKIVHLDESNRLLHEPG